MWSWFSKPKRHEQDQPLLNKITECNEVIVELPKMKIKPKIPILYDEIPSAIEMIKKLVKDSIKNSASQKEKERRWRNYCGMYNVGCLLLSPGASLSVMLLIHSYLSSLTSKLQWYKSEISRFDKEIKLCQDPMVINSMAINTNGREKYISAIYFPESGHPCYGQTHTNSLLLETSIARWSSYNWCKMNYSLVDNPHFNNEIPQYCNMTAAQFCASDSLLSPLCEYETKLLGCMDSYAARLPEQQTLKTQFIAEHGPKMAESQRNYNYIQTNPLARNSQSTFEPISTVIFGLAGTLCIAHSIYLYRSWKNSIKEHEDFFNGEASLEEYLMVSQGSAECNYIMTLIEKINKLGVLISLENTPDQIIDALKTVQKQQISKACSLSFFVAARCHWVPDEVTDIILRKAELPTLADDLKLDDRDKQELVSENVIKEMYPELRVRHF